MSCPPCRFCHASPAANFHPVDKFLPVALQPAELVGGHAGEPPGGMNHAFVQVMNGDGDEAFLLQGRDVAGDPARMQTEKVGEVLVGCKTPRSLSSE